MKPAQIAMTFLAVLLAICAAGLVVLSRKLSQSQRENLELRTQANVLRGNRSAAGEYPNQASEPIGSGKFGEAEAPYESEHRELLRLRNEAHRLRQEKAEAARLGQLKTRVLDASERVLSASENTNQPPPVVSPGTWLGIGIRPVDSVRGLGMQQGVVVSQVIRGGPCQDELEPGDIILTLDGTAISGLAQFKEVVKAKKAGSPIDLGISRANERMNVPVTPGELR